ncbi:hypothetical protein REPUB_Repub05bG0102700 [Reevesia pubescens]
MNLRKAQTTKNNKLDEEDEARPIGDGSVFTPFSYEVLSRLTRKTQKKLEREMKKKRRDDSENESENAQEVVVKKSLSTRHEDESIDSLSHEEKLSSFMKGKSFKCRMNENGVFSANPKGFFRNKRKASKCWSFF